MASRVKWAWVLGVLLAWVSPFVREMLAESARPNILFILSDDHAYQAISAYGSQLAETPHIDRIAEEGIRFDRCYVTNSICGPSRACVLTGKYSHANGYTCNDQDFDWTQATFPAMLRSAGYQTAVVGKWHLGPQMPEGFDYWNILRHQGYYYQPIFQSSLGESQHVGYVTDLITRYTLDWLRNGRDPNRPFLLMMNHKAPHRPWDPGPDRLHQHAHRGPFPEPPTLFDTYEHRSRAAQLATMRISNDLSIDGPDLKAWDHDGENHHRRWFYGKLTLDQLHAWKSAYAQKNSSLFKEGEALRGEDLVRWKYQRFLDDYLSCAAGVDDSVGKVLDYLDEAGLAENTLVVYCSDQGFFLGEHGWFDKRFMYEQSLRTPLVMRWPGVITPNRVENRIVSNVDFAQTFLAMAGAKAGEDMQGRSLMPLLTDEPTPDWRRSFYYHYYEGRDGGHNVCEHEGVTDGRFKLIHFYKLGEWELFDLETDPLEMRSCYGEPGYADTQRRLEEELNRLRLELAVPDEP